jgi:DNA polymerase III subunit epsilon
MTSQLSFLPPALMPPPLAWACLSNVHPLSEIGVTKTSVDAVISTQAMNETIAVIDFETTGMPAAQGARATEIAAVLVQGGQIVGRFQSLMNTGAWVPPFIEQFTGITNAMLKKAPPARAVMHEAARFTQGCPMVAHNAAFDRSFWQAELAQAECAPDAAHDFACTVLLSRRLYPQAPNHRLGTLAQLHALPSSGRAHRALADAEVTAHLLMRIQHDVAQQFAVSLNGAPVSHRLLAALQRAPRTGLVRCMERAVAD